MSSSVEVRCAGGSSAPAGDASDSGRVDDRDTNAGATPVPRLPARTESEVRSPEWHDGYRVGMDAALGMMPNGGICIVRAAQLDIAAESLARHGIESLSEACREAAAMLRQVAMPSEQSTHRTDDLRSTP